MYERGGVLYNVDEETREEREERKYKNRYFNEFELKDIERKDQDVEY